MPPFPNGWSLARRSWRRSANKFKTLNKQFSRYGILFVISAPSGAGKTTLWRRYGRLPIFVYSVSCTTREPRAEKSTAKIISFLPMPISGRESRPASFWSTRRCTEHYYGTLREPLLTNLKNGVDVLIDIDTQGAATIRNCGDQNSPRP